MGAAALPIALSLAGAGVSAINTNKTAKKQDRAAAEGIRKQSEIQREANKRLNESLMFFEQPQTESISTGLSDQFQKQLRLKQALALSGLEQEGAGSRDATEAARQAGGTAIDYGDFLEGIFSRIDAPIEQRRREGVERTDLSSDLLVPGRQSRGQDFLTRLRLQGIQRNPFLDFLSAGLSGASSGTALSGFSKAQQPLVPGALGPNFGIPTTPGTGGVPLSPSSLFGFFRG